MRLRVYTMGWFVTLLRTEALPLIHSPESIVIAAPSPATTASVGSAVEAPRRLTRVIALLNQKGGVGKTTTTASLGAALADDGKRVLLVDLDPQAHLTLHFGIDPTQLERSMYDLMTDGDVSPAEILCPVRHNLSLAPAEMSLAGVETELAPQLVTGRAQRLTKEKMRPLLETAIGPHANVGPHDSNGSPNDSPDAAHEDPAHTVESDAGPFDYCLIDCPPSLGLLTINALTLASEVVVPMQAHFLALQGLSKLLETVTLVNQSFNPHLSVTGLILCMHERQTILAGEVVQDLREFLESARHTDVPWRDARILEPPVRRNIKLAECPSFGQTIFEYAPNSHGANDYRALAKNL